MSINKPIKRTTRIISSEGIFTDSVEMKGYFNLSISGIWVATITIQRSFNLGDTWFDVKTFNSNSEEYGFELEGGVLYRAGIKTGHYTSGEVVVRLSQ